MATVRPSCSANAGFTLIELVVALAIGLFLILAALSLYVPVSRSLLDQAAVARATHDQGSGYDFDVLNIASAGFGVTGAAINSNLVLVSGTTQVMIPTANGQTVSGNGLFWNWQIPGGAMQCAGIGLAPASSGTNESLVSYQPTSANTCTGSYWNTSTSGNWNTVVVLPDISSASTPISVTTGTSCEARDAQMVQPVTHPQVSFTFPIANLLTSGFFNHRASTVPGAVCLPNF